MRAKFIIFDDICRELRELRSGGVRLIQDTMIIYEGCVSVACGTLMRCDSYSSRCEGS